MASVYTYFRNHDSSDTTYETFSGASGWYAKDPINDLNWSAPEDMQFKEWNSARDGTGISFQIGDELNAAETVYAIWEAIPEDTMYIAMGSELTSIANALREQTGESAMLEFPDDFLTAIATIGGGGSSSWQLLGSAEFTTSTTSTSASSVGSVSCNPSAWDSTVIIYVRTRDKAGKRNAYYTGTDSFFINYRALDPDPESSGYTTFTYGYHNVTYYKTTSGFMSLTPSANGYGVYASRINYTNGSVDIAKRYNSNIGTVNGTYSVEVYALSYPDGHSVFDS